MIIKILPTDGRTFSGVIKYNASKSEVLAIENSCSADPTLFMKELEFITEQNTRIKNPVFHAMISLSEEEKETMTNETLLSITADYMKKMGYQMQPYMVFLHGDKEHKHIHIITTRVDKTTFKKISDSFENQRSNDILEQLIFKYGLKPINGEHLGTGLVSEINHLLTYVMKKKPHNFKKLQELCENENFSVDKTKDGGYVVYLKDYKHGIKSSDLLLFKNKGLAQMLKHNNYYRQKAKKHIYGVLSEVFKNNGEIKYREFANKLRDAKIYVKISQSSSKVNGLSYYYDGFELKGSEVDAKFSWNNLKRFIVLKQGSEMKQSKGMIRQDRGSFTKSILNDLKRFNTSNKGKPTGKKKEEEEDEEERKRREQSL